MTRQDQWNFSNFRERNCRTGGWSRILAADEVVILPEQRLPMHDGEKLVFKRQREVETTFFDLLAQGIAVCVSDPECDLRVGRPAPFNKRPDEGRGQRTRHSDA